MHVQIHWNRHRFSYAGFIFHGLSEFVWNLFEHIPRNYTYIYNTAEANPFESCSHTSQTTMSSTSPHPLSAGTERIGCRPSFRIHGLVLKLGSEVHVARKAGDVRMRMIPVFKQGKAGGNKAKEIAILKICRWFCSIWIMPGVISKVQKNNGT